MKNNWITFLTILISCISCISPNKLSAEMINNLSPVCLGEGVPQTAEYQPSLQKIHPIVILSASGEESEFTRKPSLDWLPNSIGEVELVACVGKIRGSTSQCHYTHGYTVTYYLEKVPISLHEAKTGKVVASDDELISGKVKGCPYVAYTNRIENKINWRTIEHYLCRYVTGEFTPQGICGIY